MFVQVKKIFPCAFSKNLSFSFGLLVTHLKLLVCGVSRAEPALDVDAISLHTVPEAIFPSLLYYSGFFFKDQLPG